MSIARVLLCLILVVLASACAKKPDRSPRDLAVDLVRETHTVPLFRAGFAKTAPATGPARQRFGALRDDEIEELFVAQYLVEWDVATLDEILEFVRSNAGKEYVESALAQAAGEQKAISSSSRRTFELFATKRSGKKWLEGLTSIQPRVVEELIKKMGANKAVDPTPVSAP